MGSTYTINTPQQKQTETYTFDNKTAVLCLLDRKLPTCTTVLSPSPPGKKKKEPSTIRPVRRRSRQHQQVLRGSSEPTLRETKRKHRNYRSVRESPGVLSRRKKVGGGLPKIARATLMQKKKEAFEQRRAVSATSHFAIPIVRSPFSLKMLVERTPPPTTSSADKLLRCYVRTHPTLPSLDASGR